MTSAECSGLSEDAGMGQPDLFFSASFIKLVSVRVRHCEIIHTARMAAKHLLGVEGDANG